MQGEISEITVYLAAGCIVYVCTYIPADDAISNTYYIDNFRIIVDSLLLLKVYYSAYNSLTK